MHLTLLGTGLPFINPKRRGPAYLVRAGEEHFMVDCGSGAMHRLYEAGAKPFDINHMFITHLHMDHYIDLGHFIMMRWINRNDEPLHLYGPRGLQKMADQLLEMHEPDLELRQITRAKRRPDISIVVHEISEGLMLETPNGVKVSAFSVEHYPLEEPFGFRFDSKDKSIAFSGDTRPCENLIRHCQEVDVLVHEASEYTLWDSPDVDHTHQVKTHTHPEKLGFVARDAKPKLLVASHLMPRSEPWKLREMIGQGFKGNIVIGEDLMTC
ncbi:MAG: MBL fold metallo-hydrolase [Rhodospirillales bacterium]|nr:MBL fold metallo-hydrolase [Rhodospirillales bacterium]